MSTTTKTIMDQLAAELKKPKKEQRAAVIAKLNKQLDEALGTVLKPEPTDPWEE